MSSARAASELRGPSSASTSDEEVEGACVCRIRRASSASKLLYIKQYSDVELGRVPQTFNRHKLRSPPPLAPCPCLATVRHMTKDSVVPAFTKKAKLHASPWRLAKPEMKNRWMRLLAGVRGWSVMGLYRSRARETRSRLLGHRAHSGCISNETKP